MDRRRTTLLWPELHDIPICISPYFKNRQAIDLFFIITLDIFTYYHTVVPVPTDYDLPYEDLTFDTADHVKIRAYLLAQRIELEDGAPINHRGQGNGYSTDDEVSR